MAKKVIKKLDEQLNCSICLDTYTDPKLLQCSHAYCQKCLLKLVVRDQQGQLVLTCPNCRHVTPIPPNGVRGLQSAFRINEFLEIRDDLKKVKELITCQEPGLEGDTTSHNASINFSHHCSDHAGRGLEIFCETCNDLVCYKCVAKNGKHHDHDYDPLNEVFEKYKGEITCSLEPVKNQLKIIHKALEQLDTRSREISDQGVTIEVNIHDTIRKFHEILDIRKKELIDQLHQLIQRKLNYIVPQRVQMETIQAQLSSFINSIDERLMTGNHAETIKLKKTIMKQVKELTTPFQPDLLKPNTEADMIFLAIPNITASCKKYGRVFSCKSPDPSKCHVTGKNLEEAIVGQKSSATLQAIDFNSEPCEELIESLQCEMVSEITCASVNGSIERKSRSQYEISYQPTIKGRHQLHIKVEDQQIRGSPFPVVVKLLLEKLGTLTPILNIGGVNGPWGIAFNQRGEMVVSEWDGCRVSIFSSTGNMIRSFGTYGEEKRQIEHPCGVAIDGEGNILVVDCGNHHILKFTTEGQFLTSVGTKDSGSRGIAYNRTNNKVYVTENNGVKILHSDLTFSSSFGKKGRGKGQFNEPEDIACDSNGKVYVADRDNHRIQVFTAEGKFLRTFGRRGHERGELDHPISISIDNSDRVYVGDWNHRVSIFTSDNQFFTSFGQEEGGSGGFICPHGLAVDDTGVVYVCDTGNNCIQLL